MSMNLLIFSTLISSSVSCFITNSWILIWVLLELNTLAFCSLVFLSEIPLNNQKEGIINYLIIQCLASMVLVISMSLSQTIFSSFNIFALFGALAIVLNLASVPFHQWYISTVNNISWKENSLLFSWQNLAPAYLLMFQINVTVCFFILVSGISGSLFMINKKILKEIMAYSSIFNLSWMIFTSILSLNVFLVFSFLYWISLWFPVVFFFSRNSNNLENVSDSELENTSSLMIIGSLGGVPPLSGFMANWISLVCLLNVGLYGIVTFLLILSAINLYIYLRGISSIAIGFVNKNLSSAKEYEVSNNLLLVVNFLVIVLVLV